MGEARHSSQLYERYTYFRRSAAVHTAQLKHKLATANQRAVTERWLSPNAAWRTLVYFFYFNLMKGQYNLVAKQYATFLRKVVYVPARLYYMSRTRYFVEFDRLHVYIPSLYVGYFVLRSWLFAVYVVYQTGKFSYRLLKWASITSSYFLNIRRGFRQRGYMIFNSYTAY